MRTNRSAPPGPVIPELAYPDVSAAVDWLVEVLGFVECVRIGPGHRAALSFGEGSLIWTAAAEVERREAERRRGPARRCRSGDRESPRALRARPCRPRDRPHPPRRIGRRPSRLGLHRGVLFVHEQNERALSVDRAAGYQADGPDRISDFRGTRVRELRLVTQL